MYRAHFPIFNWIDWHFPKYRYSIWYIKARTSFKIYLILMVYFSQSVQSIIGATLNLNA
jgi:hypothetical protein